MTFDQFPLIEPIQAALQAAGYTTPTPIQAQSIPLLLEGRDLLGCAQTGTGKTAAFSIPIIQRLATTAPPKGMRPVRALILTPTRELAIQIGESITTYGQGCGLRHAVIFGGVSQHGQVEALRRGLDILVATPGRLLDLMQQGHVSLLMLQMFVLDEADRMLDMGFVHDVKKVLAKLPPKRQSLFFSATMPPDIVSLANTILSNPAKVSVTPVSSTAELIEQQVYFVDKDDKRALLIDLLRNPAIRSALVFTRTKHGADRVQRDLERASIRAAAIHGNKSQNARQAALGGFKEGRIRVLVATDIAARGIDVSELSHVFNYELPNIPETYVHRIGRTGRAGATGIAISLCEQEEIAYLRDIEKLIAKRVPVVSDHPYALPDHLIATPKAPAKQQGGRSGGGRQSQGAQSRGQGQGQGRQGTPRNAGDAPARKPAAQAGRRRTGPRPPRAD